MLKSNQKFISIDKVGDSDRVVEHKIKFLAPRVGYYEFDLHVKSNAYMGLDQSCKVTVTTLDNSVLPEYKVHPDDAELDDEPTLFEEMLKANIEQDSDSDNDDDDDDDEEPTKEMSAADKKKAELQKARKAAAGDDDDSDDDDAMNDSAEDKAAMDEAKKNIKEKIKDIDKEIRAIVAESADFAESAPEPELHELYTDVLVEQY